MPPLVSTSQIRMSRWLPSACPLSQGSSAQGIRSRVTRMSAMVMSGLAVLIGRFPRCFLSARQADIPTRRSADDNAAYALRSVAFGNLEHQPCRGGMRQQSALAVEDASLSSRGTAADMHGLALGAHRAGVLGH